MLRLVSACILVTFLTSTQAAAQERVWQNPNDEFGRWCGPQGDWASILVPDEWPDSCNAYTKPAAFLVACRAHDGCYGTKGALRSECDREFRAGLERECASAFNTIVCRPAKLQCRGLARIYYEAVVAWGDDAFRRAQGETPAVTVK